SHMDCLIQVRLVHQQRAAGWRESSSPRSFLQISTATRRRLEKEKPFIKHEGLKIKEASCFSPQLLSLIWARAPSASHQRDGATKREEEEAASSSER
ncbi:hypothetical protein GOODEAATRI_021802, partial [Goodea atripinnis]